jgi:NAD(P)-dependent dehydrogenase (short-subunit alcohol dehydrogenase family)
VAVHYRRSQREAEEVVALIRGAGGEAHAFATDLADEAQCRALVPEVGEAFGRIDALVNNASLFEYDGVADFGFAAMERHARANTGAPILLTQALHAAGGGVAVNLLDQKLWNPNPDHLSYTLSKAALEAATRVLAIALAPRTRVCAVAPGLTLLSGDMNEAELAAAQRTMPLQRGATPEDVAAAVRYLLEAEAVTGTTLLVDGGQHLSAQRRDVMFIAREALAREEGGPS